MRAPTGRSLDLCSPRGSKVATTARCGRRCSTRSRVIGAGEPFTLGTFTGTPPSVVNNVLTPGAGPGGTVGYEADFSFGTAYTEYAFGASTDGINSGNSDQELSAVGALTVAAASEPASLAIIGIALAGLGLARRLKGV